MSKTAAIDFTKLLGFDTMTNTAVDFQEAALSDAAGAKVGKKFAVDFRDDALSDHAGAKVSKPAAPKA